jgi:rhodanese-related sulfurtransferase
VYTANDMITNGTFPNLIVLDVRPTENYDEEHIENAISIPSAILESRIDELLQYNDTEIIVHCQLGGTSPTAAATLESHNFTKVFNLIGGFTAWKSSGFPVVPESFSIMLITTLILSTAFVAIVTQRKKFH